MLTGSISLYSMRSQSLLSTAGGGGWASYGCCAVLKRPGRGSGDPWRVGSGGGEATPDAEGTVVTLGGGRREVRKAAAEGAGLEEPKSRSHGSI